MNTKLAPEIPRDADPAQTSGPAPDPAQEGNSASQVDRQLRSSYLCCVAQIVNTDRLAVCPTNTAETPNTYSSSYLFSVVELVALRREAPRPAAQRFPANRGSVRAVPPLHAAGLSQRDNRYR